MTLCSPLLVPNANRATTNSLPDALSPDLSPADNRALRSFVEDGAMIPLPKNLAFGCAEWVTPDQGLPAKYHAVSLSRCASGLFPVQFLRFLAFCSVDFRESW
jgi:hypothetical protein